MVQNSYPEQDGGAITVAGPRRAIIVAGAGPLLPYLASLMPGWRIEPAASDAVPDLTLRPTGAGFQLDGDGLPDGPTTAKDSAMAAQLVMNALAVCYMLQLPDLVQVHAAGVKFPAGVVALLGDTRAGKTSMALHLAQLGYRVYADDRLLLGLGGQAVAGPAAEAIALCLAPRVRLPLPCDAGEDLERLVAGRTVLKLQDRAVLALRQCEIAARDEAAPLAALIRLERRDAAGATTLQAASTAEILRALLSSCLAPPDRPRGACRAGGRAGIRDALFHNRFCQQSGRGPGHCPALRIPLMRYRRNTAVRETEVEGEFFLVEPASGEIYYLDAITSGVWRLLDVPRGRGEMRDVLEQAFPETATSRIDRDLDRALADMLKAKLISSNK